MCVCLNRVYYCIPREIHKHIFLYASSMANTTVPALWSKKGFAPLNVTAHQLSVEEFCDTDVSVTNTGPAIAGAMFAVKQVARECMEHFSLGYFSGRFYLSRANAVYWYDFANDGEVVVSAPREDDNLPPKVFAQSTPCGILYCLDAECENAVTLKSPPNIGKVFCLKVYDDITETFAAALLAEDPETGTVRVWVKTDRDVDAEWDRPEIKGLDRFSVMELVHDNGQVMLVISAVGTHHDFRVRLLQVTGPERFCEDKPLTFGSKVRGMAAIGKTVLMCFGTSELVLFDVEYEKLVFRNLKLFDGVGEQCAVGVASDSKKMFAVQCADATVIWTRPVMVESKYIFSPPVYENIQTILDCSGALWPEICKTLHDALESAVQASSVTLLRMIQRRIDHVLSVDILSRLLEIACEETGNPTVVAFLLESGAVPTGHTLFKAVRGHKHDHDLVQVIAKLIHYAEIRGNVLDANRAFKALLSFQILFGKTNLFYQVAEQLCTQPCNIDEDALLRLCNTGFEPEPHLVRLMIENGCDVNARREDAGVSLGICCLTHNNPDLFTLLLRMSYQPTHTDMVHLLSSDYDTVAECHAWMWRIGMKMPLSGYVGEQMDPIQRQAHQLLHHEWTPSLNDYKNRVAPIKNMIRTTLLVSERYKSRANQNKSAAIPILPIELWYLILERVGFEPDKWLESSAVAQWCEFN